MAMVTPNTLERREYKYLIDEDTAERIRRYIGGICAVDPYAAQTGGRYLTDTLYLDTPDLASYRATVEDAGDRWKLRVRTYPSMDEPIVFFEVKRRVSETILKTRGSFRGDWARLLTATDPEILGAVGAKQRRAIDNFLCHYHYLPMAPSVLVRYEREPYFSLVDDYARLTFDRQLCFQRSTELTLQPRHERWDYTDHAVNQRGLTATSSSVLLELKFTNLVPGWMRRMVHSLDIQRLAFCKYTRAVDTMRAVPVARVAREGLWR
ncbi:MAG: polyphosphate polymerase domain-containing protein [Deltaproteobacteria bacterium]|nr:polyphosphate polymerase domain-containing protein [Deltaproteobacteria bacterium]